MLLMKPKWSVYLAHKNITLWIGIMENSSVSGQKIEVRELDGTKRTAKIWCFENFNKIMPTAEKGEDVGIAVVGKDFRLKPYDTTKAYGAQEYSGDEIHTLEDGK